MRLQALSAGTCSVPWLACRPAWDRPCIRWHLHQGTALCDVLFSSLHDALSWHPTSSGEFVSREASEHRSGAAADWVRGEWSRGDRVQSFASVLPVTPVAGGEAILSGCILLTALGRGPAAASVPVSGWWLCWCSASAFWWRRACSSWQALTRAVTMPDLAASPWVPSRKEPGRGQRLCPCSVKAHWLLRLPAAPDWGWTVARRDGSSGWSIYRSLQLPALHQTRP